MSAGSRYWNLIRIDAHRGCKSEEIHSAKAFFQEQFPQFVSGINLPDLDIQRQFWHWFRGQQLDGETFKQNLA